MSNTVGAGTSVSKFESASQLLAGLAVIVLTILGLAGLAPNLLVAIATIVFGAELLLDGTASAAELNRLLGQAAVGDGIPTSTFNSLSLVFVAGVAGIVLGILALLGVAPERLVAIAVIGFGGALLMSSSAVMRIRSMGTSAAAATQIVSRFAEGIAADTAGTQTMAGLTAIVLGILALSGIASVTLVLIALLALGCFDVLSSAFINQGLIGAFRVGART